MLRQLVRKAPDRFKTAARPHLALDMVVKGRPRLARRGIEDEGGGGEFVQPARRERQGFFEKGQEARAVASDGEIRLCWCFLPSTGSGRARRSRYEQA